MRCNTMQVQRGIINDTILLEKSKEYAQRLSCVDFSPSGGWLSRFKARHGISLRYLHGEADSVTISVMATARMELKSILRIYVYAK